MIDLEAVHACAMRNAILITTAVQEMECLTAPYPERPKWDSLTTSVTKVYTQLLSAMCDQVQVPQASWSAVRDTWDMVVGVQCASARGNVNLMKHKESSLYSIVHEEKQNLKPENLVRKVQAAISKWTIDPETSVPQALEKSAPTPTNVSASHLSANHLEDALKQKIMMEKKMLDALDPSTEYTHFSDSMKKLNA